MPKYLEMTNKETTKLCKRRKQYFLKYLNLQIELDRKNASASFLCRLKSLKFGPMIFIYNILVYEYTFGLNFRVCLFKMHSKRGPGG